MVLDLERDKNINDFSCPNMAAMRKVIAGTEFSVVEAKVAEVLFKPRR